jgi:magnesium-transporting ATPase (P-type)
MLWINLIMDTFGALALATELPSDDVFGSQALLKKRIYH